MTNIVREFDTPITVTDSEVPTRDAVPQDSKVLIEDSVEHQAGEGMTAGMSPSMETPDIFDNRPQAVVETQVTEDVLINPKPVDIAINTTITDANVADVSHPNPQSVVITSDDLQQVMTGKNDVVPALNTLPDGSVDIPRNN